MIIIGLTLGTILFTLISWPDSTKLSMWDFTGGVFTGSFAYYLLTKMGVK